jgi:hypothetical protein
VVEIHLTENAEFEVAPLDALEEQCQLPPHRGRRCRIDDVVLRSNRDGLFDAFDATWGDTGWALLKIDSIADVPSTFRHLQPYDYIGVIRLLLRTSDNETDQAARDLIASRDPRSISGVADSIFEEISCSGRGRDIGCPIPPAQIPTGGITA